MPKPTIVVPPTPANPDQLKCINLLEEYIDSGHFSEFESTFMQSRVNQRDNLGGLVYYLTTRQHTTLNNIINKFRDRGIL